MITGDPEDPAQIKKRPAKAGRQAGGAISSGASITETLVTPVAQEDNPEKSARVIAYIDGFNLYFGLKSKGWKRYYWRTYPNCACGSSNPSVLPYGHESE